MMWIREKNSLTIGSISVAKDVKILKITTRTGILQQQSIQRQNERESQFKG